jgi:hypothetical protein
LNLRRIGVEGIGGLAAAANRGDKAPADGLDGGIPSFQEQPQPELLPVLAARHIGAKRIGGSATAPDRGEEGFP